MRSKEEIMERLRELEAEYRELEKRREKAAGWERFGYTVQLQDLKTEIETLRWVLGEEVEEK